MSVLLVSVLLPVGGSWLSKEAASLAMGVAVTSTPTFTCAPKGWPECTIWKVA